MRRKALSATVCLLLLFTLFVAPRGASAATLVEDVAALVQRVIYILQKANSLRNQVQQIEAAYKDLESFADEASFSDLGSIVATLNNLYYTGASLGYLHEGVGDLWDEIFPGQGFPEFPARDQLRRLEMVRTTLARTIRATQELSANRRGSELQQLSAIAFSKLADGNLRESEANNMMQSVVVHETARTAEASLQVANILALDLSLRVQELQTAETARQNLQAVGLPTPAAVATASGNALPFELRRSSLF